MKAKKHISKGVLSAIWIILWCCIPLFVAAQPSGYAGSFSRLGFGPRGMAMGNAMTATGQEGIYSYYNPALAAKTERGNQFDLTTALMSFERSLHGLNATFALPPAAGINIGLLNANVAGIDGRTTSGYPTEELDTHEYQLMTAFGIRIASKLSAGVGIKLTLADYHTDLSNARSTGFDLGVLYEVNDTFSLGLAVQDLLASYSWDSSELYGGDSRASSTEKFPTRFVFGGSYRLQQSLLVTLDFGMLIHDEQSYKQLKMGGAWEVHERISLRAGWQIDDLAHIDTSNRPSAGFSLHLPFDKLAPSVDYAFLLEPNQISSIHIFGLRLNL